MPYEFALRPRIRLREGFEPPRRARFRLRLPKIALPVLAYWAVAAAITYQLLHWHDQPEAPAQAALAPPADTGPHWWDVPPSALPGVAPTHDVERVPVPPHAAEPPPLNDVPSVEEPIAEEAAASALAPDALAHDAPSFARDESDFGRDPRDPHDPGVRRESRAEREAEEYGRKLALRDDSAREGPMPNARRSVSSESVAAPGILGLSPLDSGNDSEREAPRSPQILGAVPPDAPAQVASALPSCEAAQARANQEVKIGEGNGAPDLSREVIARVLDNGVWIARCDIPMTTSVDLCVAIQGGKVIGASVSSRPSSAAINACVKRRAASLTFPFSARVDLARTHF